MTISSINNNHSPFAAYESALLAAESAESAESGESGDCARTTGDDFTIAQLERQLAALNDTEVPADMLGKALQIARRIMQGDIVPDNDDRFLLENYPEMHLKAWMLRQTKEEPEEHKSVLDEEKEFWRLAPADILERVGAASGCLDILA
jgi:hypothetical protein